MSSNADPKYLRTGRSQIARLLIKGRKRQLKRGSTKNTHPRAKARQRLRYLSRAIQGEPGYHRGVAGYWKLHSRNRKVDKR